MGIKTTTAQLKTAFAKLKASYDTMATNVDKNYTLMAALVDQQTVDLEKNLMSQVEAKVKEFDDGKIPLGTLAAFMNDCQTTKLEAGKKNIKKKIREGLESYNLQESKRHMVVETEFGNYQQTLRELLKAKVQKLGVDKVKGKYEESLKLLGEIDKHREAYEKADALEKNRPAI